MFVCMTSQLLLTRDFSLDWQLCTHTYNHIHKENKHKMPRNSFMRILTFNLVFKLKVQVLTKTFFFTDMSMFLLCDLFFFFLFVISIIISLSLFHFVQCAYCGCCYCLFTLLCFVLFSFNYQCTSIRFFCAELIAFRSVKVFSADREHLVHVIRVHFK